MSSTSALAADLPLVDLQEEDGLLHVKFGRHEIDAVAIDALYDAMADLEEEDAHKGVVFHLRPAGSDPGSVAGQLSDELATLGASDGLRAFTRLEKSLASIERMNKPSAVVLDGPTGTFGLELALVSDLRVGTASPKFLLRELERGVLPGMAGVFRLARYVGLGMAKRVVMHGEDISTELAVQHGIIDMVTDDVDGRVRQGMKRLIELPVSALTLARQMLHEGGTMDYRKAYEAYKAAQFHALHQLEEG